MHGWLIYDRQGYERNKGYADSYVEKAPCYGLTIDLIITDELTYGVKDGRPFFSAVSQDFVPDFAIVRTIDPFLSENLEAAGIKIFNSAFVSRIANNKAACYAFLSKHGIPMVETYFGGVAKKDRSYPLIIKSVAGHGGSEVFMVNNDNEYNDVLETLQNKQTVIQKPCETLGKDLRVYVLGGKIIAGVLRESDSSFKSNYSLGGRATLHNLTEKERALAEKIISLFDFGLAGIDLIYNGEEPLFNEIEDVVGARMLYANTDIDLVGMYLEYISTSLRKNS